VQQLFDEMPHNYELFKHPALLHNKDANLSHL